MIIINLLPKTMGIPCKGCRSASCCQRACSRLHKFLREDPECFTRVRMTERVLPDNIIVGMSDNWQSNPTKLSWQEIAGATPGYLDIDGIQCLDPGEKVLLSAYYTEGKSYKSIAEKFKISEKTVSRQLTKIKYKLREAFNSQLEGYSDKG